MKNVTSRKMFRKAGRNDARNQLRRLGGIMSSSPELMDTIQKFRTGGEVDAQRQQLIEQQRRADRGFLGNIAYPFAALADVGINLPAAALQNTLQGIQYGPIGRLTGMSDYGEEAPPYVTATPSLERVAEYMSEDDTDLFNLNLSPISSANAAVPTQDDADDLTPLVMPTQDDADDPTLPVTPAAAQDDADDPTLPVTPAQQRPQKPDPSESMPDPSIDAYGLQEQINIGNNLRKDLAAFLRNPNASEKEKNDAGLEFAGYKNPEEELSVEKRAEANVEMFRRLMGRDPEEDKKIDGYNLAMLGFLIASGDSPNALQNIARGAAAGVKNFQDTAKARQAREEKLKMAGIEKAFRDDETAKRVEVEERRIRQGYQFQTFTAAIESSDRKVELATRLGFEKVKLEAQLQQQLELAQDQNISAEKRAELQSNATMTSGLIKSLGSIATVALGQSDGTPEGLMKAVNNVLNDPEQMEKVKEIEALTNQSKTLGEKTPLRERADMRTTAGVAETVTRDAEDMLAETGVSSPTVRERDAIERLLRYYRSTETPLPPTTMQRSDGTVVRLVGMDDDNKPIYTDEPVGQ